MGRNRSWIKFTGDKRYHLNTFLTILLMVSVAGCTVLAINIGVVMQSSSFMEGTTLSNIPIIQRLALASLAGIGVILGLSFLVVFVYSQKIAGPIYRLQMMLKESLEGDLEKPLNFRRDDEFKSIPIAFNDLRMQIRERMNSGYLLANQIDQDLKDFLSEWEKQKGSGKDIKNMLKPIQEIQTQLTRLKSFLFTKGMAKD